LTEKGQKGESFRKQIVEKNIEIRECVTLDELAACVDLQREVFALPEIELSPVRHFVVTKNAGGFALGAYSRDELIGFVLSVPAFLREEKAFYSHMTAVREDFQSYGIGAKLKWAQRERALEMGVKCVKWTFEPAKARNAYFNLEKLGAIVTEYQPNFYGTDYSTSDDNGEKIGLASDRVFTEWHLESEKVRTLAGGGPFVETREPELEIEIPLDWLELISIDPLAAKNDLVRIRFNFEKAFADGLTARGFVRNDVAPKYLFYKD
jgi:predicted GNAT superfamily acetyltransferase